MQLNESGSDLNYLISHDTPGSNAGSAVALNGDDLFIAASVGLPYDTYVAKFAQPVGCPGDMTGDGAVDVVDLVALIAAWGPCAGQCEADMNGDDAVNVTDLVMLITNWGACR